MLDGSNSPRESGFQNEMKQEQVIGHKYCTSNHDHVITKPEYFGMFSSQLSSDGHQPVKRCPEKQSLDNRIIKQKRSHGSSTTLVQAMPRSKEAHASIAISDLIRKVQRSPPTNDVYLTQCDGEQMKKQTNLDPPRATECAGVLPEGQIERDKVRLISIKPSTIAASTNTRSQLKAQKAKAKSGLNSKTQSTYRGAAQKRFDDKLFFASDLVEE